MATPPTPQRQLEVVALYGKLARLAGFLSPRPGGSKGRAWRRRACPPHATEERACLSHAVLTPSTSTPALCLRPERSSRNIPCIPQYLSASASLPWAKQAPPFISGQPTQYSPNTRNGGESRYSGLQTRQLRSEPSDVWPLFSLRPGALLVSVLLVELLWSGITAQA